MRKSNIVKYSFDTKNPPPLTAKQRKELKALDEMPESAIDYSDIPASTGDEKWTRPGALIIPSENKQLVSLRLDADVLAFFRKTGKRYQTRINAVLREYIQMHRKSA